MSAQRVRKDLAEGEARGMKVRLGRDFVSIILIRKEGGYFAYRNECKHLPVPLDLAGLGFWSDDKSTLECRSHGARYDWKTGTCVDGPCPGAQLEKLSVREEKDSLVIERV